MVSQSQPRCTYVELPSKSGKVLCFLILVVCGCVIYFFPFGCKFINMCYFNYVECNFDVALPLFLYVLILLLSSPPFSPDFISSEDDLGYSACVWVMHTRCVWTYRPFQGSLKMKRNHTTLCYCGEEKHAEGFLGRARRPPTRNALKFSSSYKVYFVKPYGMNVHLVKRRYK